jgi:hypothetical protein
MKPDDLCQNTRFEWMRTRTDAFPMIPNRAEAKKMIDILNKRFRAVVDGYTELSTAEELALTNDEYNDLKVIMRIAEKEDLLKKIIIFSKANKHNKDKSDLMVRGDDSLWRKRVAEANKRSD